jgi:hypothetical protein
MSDMVMRATALRNLGEVIYKRNFSNYNRTRVNQGLQAKLEEMYTRLLTSQKKYIRIQQSDIS